MKLTTTCKCCCGWWDFDSRVPDVSSVSYISNLLVDLYLYNKSLCQIGWGIWGYELTDMSFMGGATDEWVWTGPYIDPAHPYFGAPQSVTYELFYEYQWNPVITVTGQNIYMGQVPAGEDPRDFVNANTPARWWGSGIYISEYQPDGQGQPVWVADHGFYTQWDLPVDPLPPSRFPMGQGSSYYEKWRGWVYDGPIDQSSTQDINIESTSIGPITGITDTVLVTGDEIYPLTYFYASGGKNTAGSPF